MRVSSPLERGGCLQVICEPPQEAAGSVTQPEHSLYQHGLSVLSTHPGALKYTADHLIRDKLDHIFYNTARECKFFKDHFPPLTSYIDYKIIK